MVDGEESDIWLVGQCLSWWNDVRLAAFALSFVLAKYWRFPMLSTPRDIIHRTR
jgi:hypothetical protein